MSSWFSWGTPKGKRELSPNSRRDAFKAVYIDENGPDIGTRQGQADFVRYAKAKSDPASTRYMRDQEHCTSDNKAAMDALKGKGIKYRDFALEKDERERERKREREQKDGGKKGQAQDARAAGKSFRAGQASDADRVGGYYASRRQ